MASTVGEALPLEMTRVRTKVIPAYQAILAECPAANITIAAMHASLDRAQRALAEGDVIAIIRAYEDLKGYSA